MKSLIKFGQEIVNILDSLEIEPILYGSLAYRYYSKDKKTKVNDVDMLVREKYFEEIQRELRKRKIKSRYSRKWHVLQIFNGKLLVELDSVDFWQKGRVEVGKKVNIEGLKVKVISLGGLRKIYRKSVKECTKNPKDYKKKLEGLEK